MIKFINLSLKNFMSYGANTTVIDFTHVGTTLILGKDLDNDSNGTGSNGVGKTTIIEALVYAVYGKSLSNASLPSLVNNINKKNMEVSVTFQKDNIFYRVIRARKNKGGNWIKFYKKKDSVNFTDKDEITRDSTGNTNEEIEDAVGMPYELFCRIVVFSATHIPFLLLPLAQQVKIIEELFSMTMLTEKSNVLKDRIKDTEQSYDILQVKNEQLKGEIDRHKEQISSTEFRVKNWKETREEKIKKLTNELKILSSVNIEKERKALLKMEELTTKLNALTNEYNNYSNQQRKALKEFDDWNKNNNLKIKTIERALKKVEGIDVDKQQEAYETLRELDSHIENVTSDWDDSMSTVTDLEEEIENTLHELEHLQGNKCPYCLQEYPDAKKKINETNKKLKKKEEDKKICEKDAKLMNEELKTSIKERDLIYKIIKVDNIQELVEIKEKITQYEVELETCKKTINPFSKSLEDLKKVNINKLEEQLDKLESQIEKEKEKVTVDNMDTLLGIKSKIDVHKENIANLKSEINPFIEPLNELKQVKLAVLDTKKSDELAKLIKHQKFLRNLLTKKDSFIRKTLLDKNIAYLNGKLKLYLLELGLPHVVEFTHELTARIRLSGRELDFSRLSHGQQSRVNFALSLTFRDVLEKLHDKINVCLFDEVLDIGLDAVGVESAAKIIKQKARKEELSLFIISHKAEIDRAFENIITVQLEDGFSNIMEN